MNVLKPEYNMAIFAVFTYFFASIPFGLVFSKLAGIGDIRNIGSGNIGATNVLRTGNKKDAALTLIFDVLKGALPVFISSYFIPGQEFSIGFLAILSHIFPVYLKFKGGKGVATTIGVFMAWNQVFGLLVLVSWLLTAKIFKISSLSALIAAMLAPFYAYFLGMPNHGIVFVVFIALLLLYTHRENIKLILKNEESVIS